MAYHADDDGNPSSNTSNEPEAAVQLPKPAGFDLEPERDKALLVKFMRITEQLSDTNLSQRQLVILYSGAVTGRLPC